MKDEEKQRYMLIEIFIEDSGVGNIQYGNLDGYIKKYGREGLERIYASLGHLMWELKDKYIEIQKECFVNKGGE